MPGCVGHSGLLGFQMLLIGFRAGIMKQRGLSFLFSLLPFPPAPGGKRMCQLKAESKEAYADYLPLQGSIFGCSAAANSMNRAAIQQRSHMRVIVSRMHFSALQAPRALILSCSSLFFRWQRVSQRKRGSWGQVRRTLATWCPVQHLPCCLSLQRDPEAAPDPAGATAEGSRAAPHTLLSRTSHPKQARKRGDNQSEFTSGIGVNGQAATGSKSPGT